MTRHCVRFTHTVVRRGVVCVTWLIRQFHVRAFMERFVITVMYDVCVHHHWGLRGVRALGFSLVPCDIPKGVTLTSVLCTCPFVLGMVALALTPLGSLSYGLANMTVGEEQFGAHAYCGECPAAAQAE